MDMLLWKPLIVLFAVVTSSSGPDKIAPRPEPDFIYLPTPEQKEMDRLFNQKLVDGYSTDFIRLPETAIIDAMPPSISILLPTRG